MAAEDGAGTAAAVGPIRVMIVDDHPVVRQGLLAFLDAQPDLMVVGEAPDGETAVERVAALAPDVVLLDLVMPGAGGIAAIAGLRHAHPAARVLVLTS
ncbi:MAG: response regulator, partial [Acidimicrobiia bacterium]